MMPAAQHCSLERGNRALVESLMHSEPRPFHQTVYTPYIEETIHYSLIVYYHDIKLGMTMRDFLWLYMH